MATAHSTVKGRPSGATSSAVAFTDLAIRNLPRPEGEAKLYKDLSYRQTPSGSRRRHGLALMVSPTGEKTWYARLPTKKALGRYPDLPLANARIFFDAVRDVYDAKGDWRQFIEDNRKDYLETATAPVKEEAAEKAAPKAPTNDVLVRRYVRVLAETNRKWQEQERQLQMYFLDVEVGGRRLGDLTPHELTVEHIEALVSRLTEEGKLRGAQIARGQVRTYYNWLLGRKRAPKKVVRGAKVSAMSTRPILEGLPANPCDAVHDLKYDSRSYAIQPEDIGDFLAALAASKVRTQVKRILRTQLETFTRCGEIAGLRWEEINFRKKEITIPAERRGKNLEPLVIFMTPQLEARLKAIRAEQKQAGYSGEYVFPRPQTKDGADRPLNSADVNHALNRQRKRIRRKDGRIEEWKDRRKSAKEKGGTLDIDPDCTAHSMRHTATTWAASEGVPVEVREALTGHKRDLTDMAQRYNSYSYKAERVDVLRRFADHLEALDDADES